MVRNNSGTKILQEKKTLQLMIALYCHKKHQTRASGLPADAKALCAACRDLEAYALARLTYCRYGEQKSTCEKCPTHCYRKDYKAQIKQVMRFAGPRMLLYHPLLAIGHLIRNLRVSRAVKH